MIKKIFIIYAIIIILYVIIIFNIPIWKHRICWWKENWTCLCWCYNFNKPIAQPEFGWETFLHINEKE